MRRGQSSREEGEAKNYDTTDLQEKMKTVEVKTSFPMSILAKNSLLLPSGVARVKKMDAGSSITSSSGSATGNPRNKTALTPGHSLMDWIRLGNSGVDLTGVGGVPRNVTLAELANHNKQNDAWIAIRGIVFNVTRYMDFHPGGVEELMKGVGKDATKLFDNVHAWVNYQSLLQKCIVGRLNRSSSVLTIEKSPSDTSDESDSLESSSDRKDKNGEEVPKVTMDWRQTSNSISLFYKMTGEHKGGVYYRASRISDTKLTFDLLLEKSIISYELELAAGLDWPPTCKRNYDTMELDFTFKKKSKGIWKSQGNHVSSRKPITSERTYKEYEVLSNTPLCKFVNFLLLRAKNSLEVIPPGRHLQARMKIMGVEVSRFYTPVPPCLHPKDLPSNYTSDCICLMVKRYPDGALSPSITALKVGESLTLSNALGNFTIEAFDRYSIIHMLVAGTGLTAMLGIIQRSLARRSVKSINLINFNKNEDNMFYVAQMDKACATNKLKVTHVLSEASDSWKGRRGVVCNNLLKELLGDYSAEGCIFVCGPKGFMACAKECLAKLGWKSHQMHEFDD